MTNSEILMKQMEKFRGLHYKSKRFLQWSNKHDYLFYQLYPIIDKNGNLTSELYDGTNPDPQYVLINNEVAIYIGDFLEPFIGQTAVDFSEYCTKNNCQIDEGIFIEFYNDLITGNYIDTNNDVKNLLYIDSKYIIFTDNINFYSK